jgi:hypothetical protein
MGRYLLSLLAALLLSWPALTFAEEAVGGSYRGIATIYYTLMWGILCYGLYDAFGKKAFYVGAPILAAAIYLILPPS